MQVICGLASAVLQLVLVACLFTAYTKQRADMDDQHQEYETLLAGNTAAGMIREELSQKQFEEHVTHHKLLTGRQCGYSSGCIAQRTTCVVWGVACNQCWSFR